MGFFPASRLVHCHFYIPAKFTRWKDKNITKLEVFQLFYNLLRKLNFYQKEVAPAQPRGCAGATCFYRVSQKKGTRSFTNLGRRVFVLPIQNFACIIFNPFLRHTPSLSITTWRTLSHKVFQNHNSKFRLHKRKKHVFCALCIRCLLTTHRRIRTLIFPERQFNELLGNVSGETNRPIFIPQ